MKKGSLTALAVGIFAVASPAAAASSKDLDIALSGSSIVTGESEEKLDGPYGRVFKAIRDAVDMAIDAKVLPPGRAYKGFYREWFNCVFPDSANYYASDKSYIDSKPIDMVSWLAITSKDTTVIDDKTALVGQRVGLVYEPDALLPVLPDGEAEYAVGRNETINIRKLRRGRLDAVVMPASNLRTILGAHPEWDSLSYDSDRPIAETPAAIMCHDTPKGRELVAAINAGIEAVGRERIDALITE